MSDAPEMRKVLARDVVQYEWAIWCSIEDGEPFANVVEHVVLLLHLNAPRLITGTVARDELQFLVGLGLVEVVSWSDDGQHLWFMLGTHRREHAEMLAKRPVPVTQCSSCSGTGKVPITHGSTSSKVQP